MPRGGNSEAGKLCGLLTRSKGPEDSHPDRHRDGRTDGRTDRQGRPPEAGGQPRGRKGKDTGPWPAAHRTARTRAHTHTHAKQRQRYIIKRIKTKGPDVQKKVSEEGGREEGRRRAPASAYKLQPPGKRGCWGRGGPSCAQLVSGGQRGLPWWWAGRVQIQQPLAGVTQAPWDFTLWRWPPRRRPPLLGLG